MTYYYPPYQTCTIRTSLMVYHLHLSSIIWQFRVLFQEILEDLDTEEENDYNYTIHEEQSENSHVSVTEGK